MLDHELLLRPPGADDHKFEDQVAFMQASNRRHQIPNACINTNTNNNNNKITSALKERRSNLHSMELGTTLTSQETCFMNKALNRVCTECDLKYGEVLCPSPSGMVVSNAYWCAGEREAVFHKQSADFIFPLQVCIPGRVMAMANGANSEKMEWWSDVSALPEHVFLRKELAIEAGLRGCVAMPFVKCERGDCNRPVILVVIFYSGKALQAGETVERVVHAFFNNFVLVSCNGLSRTASDLGMVWEHSFNPRMCGDNVRLLSGSRTAMRTMPIGGSRLVCGHHGSISGRARWNVKIDQCFLDERLQQFYSTQVDSAARMNRSKGHGVKVGVAQNGASLKWFAGFDDHSCGLDWQGNLWSGGRIVHRFLHGEPVCFGKGDVVSVSVDKTGSEPVLSFAVNDVTLPGKCRLSMFHPDQEIFVVVSLLWPGEQVTLEFGDSDSEPDECGISLSSEEGY